MRKRKPDLRAECQEIRPAELKAGDKVQMPFGYSTVKTAEVLADGYTFTTEPDGMGEVYVVKRSAGDWPIILTGKQAEKGRNFISRTGDRF